MRATDRKPEKKAEELHALLERRGVAFVTVAYDKQGTLLVYTRAPHNDAGIPGRFQGSRVVVQSVMRTGASR